MGARVCPRSPDERKARGQGARRDKARGARGGSAACGRAVDGTQELGRAPRAQLGSVL